MELSIIVPVYNMQDYLRECLDSLIGLNITGYEIIVVNDGSSDGSQNIIDNFVKNYPGRIKGYTQKNAGLSVARNTGLSFAQGAYVTFVDSDDYILGDAFERFWKGMKEHQLDIGVANLERDYDGRIVADDISYRKRAHLAQMGTMDGQSYIAESYDYLKDEIKVEAVTKIYNKGFLLSNHLEFRPGLIYEDTLFFVETMLAARSVRYFPYVFYRYRMRGDSIMHTVQRTNYESLWYIAWQLSIMRERAPRARIALDAMTVSLLYAASRCENVIENQTAKTMLKRATCLTLKSRIKKALMENRLKKLEWKNQNEKYSIGE